MFSDRTSYTRKHAKLRRGLAVPVFLVAVALLLSGCQTLAPGTSQVGQTSNVDLVYFLQGVQDVQREAYEQDRLIRERNESTSGGQLPMRPIIYNTGGHNTGGH